MLPSKLFAVVRRPLRSTLASFATHQFACSVTSRSVAVVLTFFFAAKSYVQKSCVLPMSSDGGVVRTGSKPFAGWPERPRTVLVSSNPFAYGSDFESRAAVMSRVERVDDASGVGVLGA